MRVGVVLSPTGSWPAILKAAQLADSSEWDAVNFWDHNHSEQPEWSCVCGWSAYGAIATATKRIRLVPMVIARLNYTLSVLAKESSILSIACDGRLELGIWPAIIPWSAPPDTNRIRMRSVVSPL